MTPEDSEPSPVQDIAATAAEDLHAYADAMMVSDDLMTYAPDAAILKALTAIHDAAARLDRARRALIICGGVDRKPGQRAMAEAAGLSQSTVARTVRAAASGGHEITEDDAPNWWREAHQ